MNKIVLTVADDLPLTEAVQNQTLPTIAVQGAIARNNDRSVGVFLTITPDTKVILDDAQKANNSAEFLDAARGFVTAFDEAFSSCFGVSGIDFIVSQFFARKMKEDLETNRAHAAEHAFSSHAHKDQALN